MSAIEPAFSTIETAIKALQKGRMIILVDDEGRENEGDLVVCGAHATLESMQIMLQHGSGIICLAMTQEDCLRLDLPPMVANNNSAHQTPFTVSFEAASGITTGVSAADRLHSIHVASHPSSQRDDIVKPGHIFPLSAHSKGVIARAGHTEGSIDLMKAAGLPTTAAICEVMNSDGSMARLSDLKLLSKRYEIPIVNIQDLIRYRTSQECWLTPTESVSLATQDYGVLTLTVFQDHMYEQEYSVISKSPWGKQPLVRIHSQCFTGDVLGALRCDCGEQLKMALNTISQRGGICIYTPQEGRGIGLTEKIKAYALQNKGLDTVDANMHLGHLPDQRDYGGCAQILRHLGVRQVRLLTNNPSKEQGLRDYGVESVVCEPLLVPPNSHNIDYLSAKRDRLGHHVLQGDNIW